MMSGLLTPHICAVSCSADASASLAGRGYAAKVSDFGLSRVLEHKSKVVTKTYGTITHMPPELLEKGIASKAADVYSFGVLLWQVGGRIGVYCSIVLRVVVCQLFIAMMLACVLSADNLQSQTCA